MYLNPYVYKPKYGAYKNSDKQRTGKKFRELAMRKYGYKKGALSKLAEEIIRKYIEEERLSKRKISFSEFVGVFKIKESGVEYTRKIRKEAEKRLKKMGL